MMSCAETSFSSMRTYLSDNNRTAVTSCIHILSLGFSSNVVMLFFFYISLSMKYLLNIKYYILYLIIQYINND